MASERLSFPSPEEYGSSVRLAPIDGLMRRVMRCSIVLISNNIRSDTNHAPSKVAIVRKVLDGEVARDRVAGTDDRPALTRRQSAEAADVQRAR